MPPNVEQRTNAAVVLAASGCTESPAEMMTLREDLGVTKKVPLLPPLSKSMSSVPLPLYKMAEVAEHNTKEDCWVVMDNRVYGVEQWLIDPDAFCGDAPPPDFKPLTKIPQGHIWDYVKLAEGFGGRGFTVQTNEDLAAVMERLHEVPINSVTEEPTFTLVAVRVPEKDLPSNTLWKLSCD